MAFSVKRKKITNEMRIFTLDRKRRGKVICKFVLAHCLILPPFHVSAAMATLLHQ